MINYLLIPEHEITEAQLAQITELRNICFSKYKVPRSYGKQLPHFRYLGMDGDALVAYVGIDFRVIRLGDEAVTILGIVDFSVAVSCRSNGIASTMLEVLSSIADKSLADFIVLFADDSRLYERNGFQRKSNTCSWLKINEHKNLGIGKDSLADCLMVKPVGDKEWNDEEVDLLGYLF